MLFFKRLLLVLPVCQILTAEPHHFSVAKQLSDVLPSILKIKAQKSESPEENNELISADSGGSGFVFDSTHVVTNAHVIGDARKIVVVDQNNTEYRAVLVGKDTKSDIAVLEVTETRLPVLKEIRSSAETGEGVFLVGFPYSLGPSISLGVVSGKDRFLPNYPYIPFIQTDAAVNPGNSGGPMFNLSGKLVGMVSTYYTRKGGYTNIAFAIPSNDVIRIAEALIRNKNIVRGYMGAELLISEKVARKLGVQNGVIVTKTDSGYAADKAGIEAGDIIVAVNGKRIQDGGELHRELERSTPGDTVDIKGIREGKPYMTQIRLETPVVAKEETTNIGKNDAAEKMGMVLRETELGPEVVISYGISKTIGYVQGDRIVECEGKALNSINALNECLGGLRENEFGFATLERSNKRFRLPIGTKMAVKGYSSRN